MIRRTRLPAAVLLAALALAGCGAMGNRIQPVASLASPVSLETSGPVAGTDAGWYAAIADGDMSRAGVTVHTRTAADPGAVLADVAAGRVDVGVISEPQLMLARQTGALVLAFGAVTQRPATVLVSLRSARIRSLRDLRGRTVGTDGQPAEIRLLDVALTRAGVPTGSVALRNVGADPAGALRSRQVAAAFGTQDGTVVELRQAHRDVRVLSLTAAGLPDYDDQVFICTEIYFANHVALLRRFVQAVGRGWSAVRADPAGGARALTAVDPSLSATRAQASVRAALPLTFPTGGEPWGWQVQHQWNVFGRFLVHAGVLRNGEGWIAASTNQLLAGQGP